MGLIAEPEAELRQFVDSLSGSWQVGAFALSCAERLYPVCRVLSPIDEVGCALREALDVGWALLDSAKENDRPILEVLGPVERAVTVDADYGEYHSFVVEALLCGFHACEAASNDSKQSAFYAASHALEIHYLLASETWLTLSATEVVASPIVQMERMRQQRDVTLIQMADGSQSSPIDEVQRRTAAKLRAVASSEGSQLAEKINGREVPSDESSVSPDQLGLWS